MLVNLSDTIPWIDLLLSPFSLYSVNCRQQRIHCQEADLDDLQGMTTFGQFGGEFGLL